MPLGKALTCTCTPDPGVNGQLVGQGLKTAVRLNSFERCDGSRAVPYVLLGVEMAYE